MNHWSSLLSYQTWLLPPTVTTVSTKSITIEAEEVAAAPTTNTEEDIGVTVVLEKAARIEVVEVIVVIAVEKAATVVVAEADQEEVVVVTVRRPPIPSPCAFESIRDCRAVSAGYRVPGKSIGGCVIRPFDT